MNSWCKSKKQSDVNSQSTIGSEAPEFDTEGFLMIHKWNQFVHDFIYNIHCINIYLLLKTWFYYYYIVRKKLNLSRSTISLDLCCRHDGEHQEANKGQVREYHRESDSVAVLAKMVTDGHPTSMAIPISSNISYCCCSSTTSQHQAHHALRKKKRKTVNNMNCHIDSYNVFRFF